jgi:hypothetical protein
LDKSVDEGRASIAGATDADMQKNWTFKFGDIAIPGMYGPSADEG